MFDSTDEQFVELQWQVRLFYNGSPKHCLLIDWRSTNRKNALKYIQDALRSVNEIEQIREILEITKTLSEDSGSSYSRRFPSLNICLSVTHIQIDCLEKYPQIIDYLVENVSSFDQLIREYLYPTIVHSIGNANNRVERRMFAINRIHCSTRSCLDSKVESNLSDSFVWTLLGQDRRDRTRFDPIIVSTRTILRWFQERIDSRWFSAKSRIETAIVDFV